MDGSPAKPLEVELQGVSGTIATKARVVRTRTTQLDRITRSCLHVHDLAPSERRGVVVERVGVQSSSITFAAAAGLHACDGAQVSQERSDWCGVAFGLLRHGRLDDPRLDVAACRTASGDPVAFVWVTADPQTRYVAVGQDDYTEVYEQAGNLPLRIATTTGIEAGGSRATFRVTEHDARGRLVRRYELAAVPAG